MKNIHIRFIKQTFINKISEKTVSYYMQRKTIFGNWKDIGYWQAGGYGDRVWITYTNESKKKLLAEVLEHYYEIPENKVIIFQHSTLKIY